MNTFDFYKNSSLDTDSYGYDEHIQTYTQFGGSNNKPKGGFPPIYLCSYGKDKIENREMQMTDHMDM